MAGKDGQAWAFFGILICGRGQVDVLLLPMATKKQAMSQDLVSCRFSVVRGTPGIANFT